MHYKDILNAVWFVQNSPKQNEFYTTWWNQILTWISLLNIFYFLFAFLSGKFTKNSEIKFSKDSHFKKFWSILYRYQPLLALVYVGVCAMRSIFPRMDGDRTCLDDHWIASVMIGRSGATLAELCYCAQLCLATICISGRTALANDLIIANVIAQSCCWFTVLTKDNRGHTVEESIWCLTGVLLTYFCYSTYKKQQKNNNYLLFSRDAGAFIRSCLLVGPVYVLFMCTIDVPMYYKRYLTDLDKGTIFLSFFEGFQEIQKCRVVTKLDSYWITEMPWMSLYFSFAVWSSLWLAQAKLIKSDVVSKNI